MLAVCTHGKSFGWSFSVAWDLSLCPRGLVGGGVMTALAYNGIFVPYRSLEVSNPTLPFAFGIRAAGGR